MVQIKIDDGVLEGEYLENDLCGKFYSFKGIPYAAPPVGNLRFKAPQPVAPWDGVRKATKHGDQCYQTFDLLTRQFNPAGSEDCLYINVYSPDIQPSKPLPVMVYIHGGAFMSGSGDDDVYGPEFLIRHGVILVTFNYRLGVLGFLCLDTEEIPGNAGMKDQVAALRWVQNNISHFGGDKNNVTIFGESAGGGSVSFHLISPMSKGLFQRAIAQSGAAINPWTMAFLPRERGLLLAKKLGQRSETDEELNVFFKEAPVTSLGNQELSICAIEASKPGVYFSVVSEKKFEDNERFFYGDVYDAIRNGVHENVEIMTGYTEDEGLIMMANRPIAELCDRINNFSDSFVPKDIRINCKLADQIEASKSLQKFYFKNEYPTEENCCHAVKEMMDFDTFIHGVIQSAKLYANKNRKTYLYKFTCHSERNLFVHMLGLSKTIGNKEVTCHADDLAYLFPERIVDHQPIKESTMNIIDNVTKLWTNFAKFGNPTPDDALGVKWVPYTLDTQKYLDIGNNLSMHQHPDKEEVEFWENLYRKYVPGLVLK